MIKDFLQLVSGDKALHLLYSFFLTIVITALLDPIFGVCIALFFGLAKEIYDEYYGSGWCWYDILADVVGVSFAICCSFFF